MTLTHYPNKLQMIKKTLAFN